MLNTQHCLTRFGSVFVDFTHVITINKRKGYLMLAQKNGVRYPGRLPLGTRFLCFGTPKWPPWLTWISRIVCRKLDWNCFGLALLHFMTGLKISCHFLSHPEIMAKLYACDSLFLHECALCLSVNFLWLAKTVYLQPRFQGLSCLPPLLNDKGGRQERPWKRGWLFCLFLRHAIWKKTECYFVSLNSRRKG